MHEKNTHRDTYYSATVKKKSMSSEDGTGGHHTKQNKPDSEISCTFSFIGIKYNLYFSKGMKVEAILFV